MIPRLRCRGPIEASEKFPAVVRLGVGVFPARVGMNRKVPLEALPVIGVPRASGDEPAIGGGRVGGYRVLLEMEESWLTIYCTLHRGEAYR